MADGILNPIEQLEADLDFEVYTKQEVDALLDEKADKSDTYTKTETDALLDDKADADAVYTKTETDTLLSAKADKSTTLAGYGITDAYTKTETDNLLNGKADADDVYTKSEIDTKIPSSVGSATKPIYVNGGILTECTHELNKTVPANAVFTDTTYTAGNGLNLSGTSFSAKAGMNVTVDSSGINVNGSGVVASADSGLVSGGTAYTELRPTLDGTWVKNAQTTATNLQKLEGGIEYLYAILSKQYDQLKKYINGNYYDYDTDTDSKYVKSVPSGAMPYASLEQIGGKTLVWNQLIRSGASTSTVNDITFTNNGDGSWTLNGTASADGNKRLDNLFISIKSTHKYYLGGCPSGGSDSTFYLLVNGLKREYGDGRVDNSPSNTPYGSTTFVFKTGTSFSNLTIYPIVRDMTLMFGAGNEPTLAEYNAMFPNDKNTTYDTGSLLSAGVTEVVSKDSDDTEIETYPIPAEIQALEGYGWSAGSVYNYVDFERKVFVKNVASVDLSTLTWGYGPSVGWSATLPNVKNPADDDTAFNGLSATLKVTDRNTQATAFSGGTDAGMVSVSGGKVYVGTGDIGIVPSGTLYYELDEPVETDISEYLTDDNLISVESGGTLSFPNQHGDNYRIPVPSAETYMVDLQSALGE